MRFRVSLNKRDLFATGLLCLMGLAAVLQVSAVSAAQVNSLAFKAAAVGASVAMMLSGIICVFNSRLSPDDYDDTEIAPCKWRSVCGVASGVFVFLIVHRYMGVLPASFGLTLLTVLGDHRHSFLSALLMACVITVALGLLLAWRSNHLPLMHIMF